MHFILKAFMAGCLVLGSASGASSGNTPVTGGAYSYSGNSVMQMIASSPEHSTLAAMLQTTGLDQTLAGKGVFTIFAPVNSAFTALHPGMLDQYTNPARRAELHRFLSCHILLGRVDTDTLRRMLAVQAGPYMIKTLGGCYVGVEVKAGMIQLRDERGTIVSILAPDMRRSNGEVQVIDRVLMPGN